MDVLKIDEGTPSTRASSGKSGCHALHYFNTCTPRHFHNSFTHTHLTKLASEHHTATIYNTHPSNTSHLLSHRRRFLRPKSSLVSCNLVLPFRFRSITTMSRSDTFSANREDLLAAQSSSMLPKSKRSESSTRCMSPESSGPPSLVQSITYKSDVSLKCVPSSSDPPSPRGIRFRRMTSHPTSGNVYLSSIRDRSKSSLCSQLLDHFVAAKEKEMNKIGSYTLKEKRLAEDPLRSVITLAHRMQGMMESIRRLANSLRQPRTLGRALFKAVIDLSQSCAQLFWQIGRASGRYEGLVRQGCFPWRLHTLARVWGKDAAFYGKWAAKLKEMVEERGDRSMAILCPATRSQRQQAPRSSKGKMHT